MGYTHYWPTKKAGIPQDKWDSICEDVTKLLSNVPNNIEISWEYDKKNKTPEVSKSLIRFNGKGDLGHETFYMERKPEARSYEKEDTVFAFCKTAHKPYDLIVCGVLIVAHKHAGEFVEVSSDGDEENWEPALDWVTSVLGTGYENPIAKS